MTLVPERRTVSRLRVNLAVKVEWEVSGLTFAGSTEDISSVGVRVRILDGAFRRKQIHPNTVKGSRVRLTAHYPLDGNRAAAMGVYKPEAIAGLGFAVPPSLLARLELSGRVVWNYGDQLGVAIDSQALHVVMEGK